MIDFHSSLPFSAPKAITYTFQSLFLCSQESEHQSQIEELKQEIEQRQYQINELDEEISHVRGNVEELQHELQAKGQEILSVRREANSQIR